MEFHWEIELQRPAGDAAKANWQRNPVRSELYVLEIHRHYVVGHSPQLGIMLQRGGARNASSESIRSKWPSRSFGLRHNSPDQCQLDRRTAVREWQAIREQGLRYG